MSKITKTPLILTTLLYLIAVAIINPFAEFAVNDDWDFYTHVKNFLEGDFVKNSLIDSSFVLQGLLATSITTIFGLNHVVLKALTVVVTLVFILGTSKILDLLNLSPTQKFLALLTILFNPFVFSSSMTFMTEIYFLCLVVWSIYFLLKFLATAIPKYLLYSVIISSLSLLVRQLGFLIAPTIILYALYYVLYVERKNLKKVYKRFFGYLMIFGIIAVISFTWPQYNADNEKPSELIFRAISDFFDLKRILHDIYYFLPYLGFSLLPLGIATFFKTTSKIKILIILLTTALFMSFYKYDIFKFGNVLYPEGLMLKINYTFHLNLFNNIIFKTALNALSLVSALSVLFLLIQNRQQIKSPKQNVFQNALFIIAAVFILPILIYPNFFDRYLVNGLVVMVMLLSPHFLKKPTQVEKFGATLVATFLVFYSFAISQDFFATTKVQWQHAAKLKSQRVLKDNIFLSGTFTRFNYVFPKKNNPEIKSALPMGVKYQCYVQKQTKQNESNLIYRILNRIETSRKVNNLLQNPKPFESGTLPGYREPTNDPNKIVFKEKINLLPELLVGNTTYIITYCNY